MVKRIYWLLVVCLLPSTTFASQYFNQIGWITPESQVHKLLQYPDILDSIYRDNDNQLIWFDLQQSSKLEFQLEVIQQAGFSSLFNRQLSYLNFYRKSNRWYEYDLLATDTTLLYLSYATLAQSQGKDWFFEQRLTGTLPPPPVSVQIAFKRSVIHQELAELIESFTPDSDGYHNLIDTYLNVVRFQKLDLPLYQQYGLKRVGDKIEQRDVLLQRLAIVDVDLIDVDKEATWYDKSLEPAIKQFQRLHGLKPDGVIGPNTIKWINLPLEQRLSTLAINAERIRYWPTARDTIIVVNVPSFEMTYWDDGQEVFESKVVVGKIARPTPLMTTRLDSLILNPTWNVPWKIMVEDIIPKVQEDREYLTRQNIKIIPKWGSKDEINPDTIDWDNLTPSAFPYRMTQLSGNHNALGLYKFNTPNRRAIYLHDTPSKGLFSEEQRAFSSGCIRVENADVFANRLIDTYGVIREENVTSEPKSNHAIPLRNRIPVHIIYQTAWYEEGNVHYREDIYRLDGNSLI
ncbi:murein L,D-transpeptidase [Vibrio aquaticus]|uniref:Murein L,D-transpeptidase n=1 Tax=Vibrio aquaticus TaxID=2496559 RepID=A0A432CXW4_9VIBR|nr:L,D-transpeptidase family protein [Vibrio aquaticus]RTZ16692.1 murein L,D-transpeptidase [Vibrio aquaticus]